MAMKVFITDPFSQSTRVLEEVLATSSLSQFKQSIYIEIGVKIEEQGMFM